MTIQRRLRVTLLTALCLAMCLCTTAFADTDGTEPKITQQPDQLVLQLGTRWAGVEFELRTDAGVFPAPIVVDETGVLTMDLGGSTTYTPVSYTHLMIPRRTHSDCCSALICSTKGCTSRTLMGSSCSVQQKVQRCTYSRSDDVWHPRLEPIPHPLFLTLSTIMPP